jgi:hypothetical protein
MKYHQKVTETCSYIILVDLETHQFIGEVVDQYGEHIDLTEAFETVEEAESAARQLAEKSSDEQSLK